MKLSQIRAACVRHFGEMGRSWGVSRTVAEIFALLYTSPQALSADEIGAYLGFSRSNISMGLKELQSWRLVRLQHLPGDRREYFSTHDDIWQSVRLIVAERRRRALDPMLTILGGLLQAKPDDAEDAKMQARLRDMHEVVLLLSQWSEDVQKLSSEDLVQLLGLGGNLVPLLQGKAELDGSLE